MRLVLNRTPNDLAAIFAAAAGGALGYAGFWWLWNSGFYALILPGSLIGLGAGLVAHRAWWVAIASGLAGLVLGLFTEYRHAPFLADGGLGYFFLHVTDLRPVTLMLVGLGAAIAFWGPFRSRIR